MAEKLGRYLLGVVPISNATGSDTYYEDKSLALGIPKTKNKFCAYCGEKARPNKSVCVDEDRNIRVHRNPCLQKYRKMMDTEH